MEIHDVIYGVVIGTYITYAFVQGELGFIYSALMLIVLFFMLIAITQARKFIPLSKDQLEIVTKKFYRKRTYSMLHPKWYHFYIIVFSMFLDIIFFYSDSQTRFFIFPASIVWIIIRRGSNNIDKMIAYANYQLQQEETAETTEEDKVEGNK